MSQDYRLPRPQVLLDAIEIETPISLKARLWRVVTDGRDPLSAGRSGGRWDDGSFDALYTSSERDGALAEAWFHAARGQPIPPSKPKKRIHQVNAELTRVLDLSGEGRLAALGVDMQRYGQLSYVQRGGEYPTTQQIGEVAFFYEYEAVVVPNARWPTSNVVILTEHASISGLSADEGELIDLASWRSLNRPK
ncbi:RES domain-containing protein [Novosphingobium sp. SG751A]|uniref:RES family NAD+ phosphorylase n=1 Tax=Novosphingobium sp. SG751A TaxID=2587000 RepID=UPI0015553DAF|nr:RES family NAD+ phosphorylase [Novosphingobium sp. SG751A]NOW45013.1 RES domain-containing protein [Novosphingobium sp. SG751A]